MTHRSVADSGFSMMYPLLARNSFRSASHYRSLVRVGRSTCSLSWPSLA